MVLAYSSELNSTPKGQATAANSLPVVLNSDTVAATSALQTEGNTTLANILAKIITAPATQALQEALNAAVSAINAKFSALGQQTIANSVSVVPATGATVPVSSTTLATAANQTSQTTRLTNLNAVLATGTWAGGTADNAAVTGTIPAPGANKAIFFKNLTFSYGSAPTAPRVLTVSEGASDIVNFAITAAGAGFVPIGVAAAVNTAVTFSLPAAGTAGVTGRLRIYYSIVDAIV